MHGVWDAGRQGGGGCLENTLFQTRASGYVPLTGGPLMEGLRAHCVPRAGDEIGPPLHFLPALVVGR